MLICTLKTGLRPALFFLAATVGFAAPVTKAVPAKKTQRTTLIQHKTNTHHQVRSTHARSQVATASYYSNHYNGLKTANGERFSNEAMTAASPHLPLGSRVRVTNLQNKKTVVVRVTDRGPYVKGRQLDVSKRAARQLGFEQAGVTKVRITPLG